MTKGTSFEQSSGTMDQDKKRLCAADYIRLNSQAILKAWADRVRAEVPAAAERKDEALFNSLPEFLDGVALFISTTPDSPGGDQSVTVVEQTCLIHGRKRARDIGYTLDQVMMEYRILRQTLFRSLEKECELTPLEREKLLDGISCGIMQAATEFALGRGLPDAKRETEEAKSRLTESRQQVEDLHSERKVRENFVSMLAHDLRTPLATIRMAAELIDKQAEDAQRVKALAAKIVGGVSRVDKMIRDLLDANRVRAGEALPIKIEEADLAAVARETISELATVHGNRFVLNSEPTVIGWFSPSDMRRVLENLLSNALKYGDQKTPIEIRLKTDSEKIRIEVHNDGIPIPKDQQAQLFKQYGRLRNAETRGQHGWGIGLTIVSGVVYSHGGKVSVQSEAGKGTTFVIEIARDTRATKRAA